MWNTITFNVAQPDCIYEMKEHFQGCWDLCKAFYKVSFIFKLPWASDSKSKVSGISIISECTVQCYIEKASAPAGYCIEIHLYSPVPYASSLDRCTVVWYEEGRESSALITPQHCRCLSIMTPLLLYSAFKCIAAFTFLLHDKSSIVWSVQT